MNKKFKLFSITLLLIISFGFIFTTNSTRLYALENTHNKENTTTQIETVQNENKNQKTENTESEINEKENNITNESKINKESGNAEENRISNEIIDLTDNQNLEEKIEQTLNTDCKIKVIGLGKFCVKPETATIRFSVKTTKETLDGLEIENTEKVNNIISSLNKFNVLKENIKNTSYSIYKKYDYKNGEQVFLGHEISNNLEIKLKDLNIITKIISALNDNDVSEIYSVSFSIEDNNTSYNNALKNALENAKIKAQIFTGKKEIKVCKIIECNENHASILKTTRFIAENLNNENFTEIMQNEICINAKIIVEFCVV